MSLGKIATAFVLVAILFNMIGWATGRRADARTHGRTGAPMDQGPPRAWIRRVAVVLTVEALALTLLAALWFASLGHGGWVSIFLLLGALASGADRWIRTPASPGPVRRELTAVLVVLAKYLLAGALLTWRLG